VSCVLSFSFSLGCFVQFLGVLFSTADLASRYANDCFIASLRPLLAEEVAKSAVWMLQQPEKISIKALDVVPSAQRSLSVFDRQWNERRQGS
jgi:hypothetical protein